MKTAATAVLTSHMDVIKNNIIKYIKSQVGSSVQKASAVDVTVGEVLAATYVEGYAYAAAGVRPGVRPLARRRWLRVEPDAP